jgi:plastocyanin
MNNIRFWTLILALLVLAVPAHAAAVKGKVVFEGTPPVMDKIKMDADPQCALKHPDGHASEEVIVNTNGTLKNVFVYVKEGLTGKFEAPKTPVVFDQQGCRYEPRIFGVQAGQPIQILNSDPTLHNVHALPAKSPQFNLGMPIQGMKLTKTFTSPEVMVKIKCEVHPWMVAYAGVLDHPFYSVSNAEGQVELKDLAPGTYVLEAWHEKYGAQTQSVTIGGADETQEIAFTFKG